MGKGMKAGRVPKDLKKLSQAFRRYEAEERKRLVDFVKADIEQDVSQTLTYYHNIDMLAVMFSLRDEFGFGKNRLLRTMEKTVNHAERMLRDHAKVDEMLQLLKEETGICEDELVWQVEVEM